MNKYAKIISSGSYLPEKILTNKELESIVDTTDEWITERTGIKERRVSSDDETSVDMAYQASIDEIDKSGIKKDEIGAIFLATCTPERKFPSTAVLLQNRLNIKNAFSVDLNAACTGFVYALDIAKKYIESEQVKYALVVGTEKITSLNPPASLLEMLISSSCHFFLEQTFSYILYKSEQKRVASNPPVPALISTIAFFLSSKSFGNRKILSLFSYSAFLTVNSLISFLANLSISSSLLGSLIRFSRSCFSSSIFK